MGEPTPRRRRRSRREPDAEPPPDPTAPADLDEELAGERGLRGLVGGGLSQVNVRAALRARDATRPGPEHLADAGTNLVIIRRGWSPPADPR
jgi:hypothetical protein